MNPFFAGMYDGQTTYYCDVPSRLECIAHFDLAQCRAALKVKGLQLTVRTAVLRRIRRLMAAAGPVSGVCSKCGCTHNDACEGGCYWVDNSETLCSACAKDRR